MQINIQSKNIELSSEVKEYAQKRISSLEKFLSRGGSEPRINFELIRTTNHHKTGDIFEANCKIYASGKEYFCQSHHEDLHSAIDEVREKLYQEIIKDKDRRQTLMKRGAASIKKMLKGLSKRNPFTSKY